METSERQLLRARFAWLCKWLLSDVCGGGCFTVNLVCSVSKNKKKQRKTRKKKKNNEKQKKQMEKKRTTI